jgi:uncharacterized membrane protein
MKIRKVLVLLALAIAVIAMCKGALALDFSLTANVTFNEDSSATLNLSSYLSLGSSESFTNFTADEPTNIKIVISGSMATFSTKNANWYGEEVVNITAYGKDGSGTVISKKSNTKVIVNPVNDAPVLNLPQNLKFRSGQAIDYQVNATDVDGDVLTFTANAGDWTTFVMDSSGRIQFTPTDDDIGLHEVAITVSDGTVNVTKKTNILISYEDDRNELAISNVELTDETGDENTLAPGDTLSISFDVDNKISATIKSIKVSTWLVSDTGKRLTDKYQFEAFSLEGKDSQTLDYKFQIPFDIEDGSDVYVVISAKGTNEERDESTSTLYIVGQKVERDTHKIAFESVSASGNIECGSIIDLTVSLWNIGTETENVYLEAQSSDLKIKELTEPFTMKAKGSSANAIKTISIQIPTSAATKNYTLNILAHYNDNKSAEVFKYPLAVYCSNPVQKQGIGKLDLPTTSYEGKSGQSISFTVTLKNTGDVAATYDLELQGLSGWAKGSISPDSVTLNPGESKELSITITPNADAVGDKIVSLIASANNVVVDSKDISISLQKQGIQITPINLTSENTQALFVIAVGIIVAIALLLLGRRRSASIEVYGESRRGPGRPPKSQLE